MSVFTLTSGTDNFLGSPTTADYFRTTVANLDSSNSLNANGGGKGALNFLDSGTILASQFGPGISGINIINLTQNGTTLFLDNQILNQTSTSATPGNLRVNAPAAGGAIVDATAVGDPSAPLLMHNYQLAFFGGTGSDTLIVTADTINNNAFRFYGQGGDDTLLVEGGGSVDLNNSVFFATKIQVTLDGTDQFFVQMRDGGGVINMGGSSDTVVIGGVKGVDTFNFGAAGQIATGGTGTNFYNFDSSTFCGSSVQGAGYYNTVDFNGGGIFSIGDDWGLNLSGVQAIRIDSSDTALFVDDWNSYKISAGNGNNVFDLHSAGGHTVLTSGNGMNDVILGCSTQKITLGTGVNNVFVSEHDLKSWSVLNGGSGDSNTLIVTPGSCDPFYSLDPANGHQITTTFDEYGPACPDGCWVHMGQHVVGFSVVDFSYFLKHARFVANDTAGLTVYGSTNGGDCVVLNATSQNYDGNHNYFDGPTCSNTVVLNAGGLDAGVMLNGGFESDCNTLVLAQAGTYNFPGATISNFLNVKVESTDTNLQLDNNGTGSNGGYIVKIDAHCDAAINDAIIGGAGDDIFNICSSADSVAFTGLLNGGGGTNELNINHGNVDLTGMVLSNLASIDINSADASLVLTSAQITALNAQPSGFTLSDDVGADLTIDVSGTSFNLADLHLENFGSSGIAIVANNLGDTIYGNNEVAGPVLIELGHDSTHSDWVNAGSNATTVVAAADSGINSVLIAGDGNDTFRFGTDGQTMVTQDSILGPSTGFLTVEVVDGATVDFTGAYLQGVEKLTIDANATAIFTLGELQALPTLTLNPGLVIDPPAGATLDVIADNNVSNTLVDSDLLTFSGSVVVDVTGVNNVGPLPGVVVDVSGVSIASDVTVLANDSGFETIKLGDGAKNVVVGTGVNDIIGGATGTQHAIFNADKTSFDIFDSAGAISVLDFHANVNLEGATFTVHGSPSFPLDVTANIDEGKTVTIAAADVSGIHSGLKVNNGTTSPTLNAHAVFNMGTAGKVIHTFLQSSVVVGPTVSSFVDETINGTGAIDTITLDTLGIMTAVSAGGGSDAVNVVGGLSI